ncbi:MAG: hypothetical protein AB3N22_10745 [Ruegeria sp.]
MPSQSLNILGVVRNGGTALTETLGCIERLRQELAESRVIIATNDNTDDTDRILGDFVAGSNGVDVLTMDGLSATCPDRVDRICHARNEVLGRLFATGPLYPMTLILDLDGPNTALNSQAVLGAMSRRVPHWDAVFGNPQPSYYDLYALRCEGWCDEDVWQRIHSESKPLFFRKRWRQNLLQRLVYDRQYHIPADAPLIPVKSGFAGLGLYRTDSLDGLRYSSRGDDGGRVCEHVLLHRQMRARGARLFIDPGLTTLAPSEHLGEASGAPLPKHLYGESTSIG